MAAAGSAEAAMAVVDVGEEDSEEAARAGEAEDSAAEEAETGLAETGLAEEGLAMAAELVAGSAAHQSRRKTSLRDRHKLFGLL